MNDIVRRRGWSISSSTDDTRPSEIPVFPPRVSARPRANTDFSEDTLTPSQKEELLKFPDMDELEDSRIKAIDSNGGAKKRSKSDIMMEDKNSCKVMGIRSENDCERDMNEMFGGNGGVDGEEPKEDDMIEMFGDEDCPPKKKLKINGNDTIDIEDNEGENAETEGNNQSQAKKEEDAKSLEKLEARKKTLSKWASRLFDPNRIRGLVETPQIIPQNDEFLKQFGRREKEFSNAIGENIDIDRGNLDEVDDDDEKTDDNSVKDKEAKVEGFKVKISNLSYHTSTETLTLSCEKYGPLVEVNLIMNPDSSNSDDSNKNNRRRQLSLGRAFVIFETLEGAESCVDGMNEKILEGRQLRVAKADSKRSTKKSMCGKVKSRYWEKDITTKCYRCGKVGHMADNCPNEELPKPCTYCAKIGHDTYSCPLSKICFKCGVPGHINRDCPERRHIPRRLVCGICFLSGHDRWQCRERICDIPNYKALCFVCGDRGHFMCKPMQWFFGLSGISCFNCGQAGHHGNECKRPKLQDLSRNNELTIEEIKYAESLSSMEANENSRQRDGCNRYQDDMRYRDDKNHRGRERGYDRDYNNMISERSSSYQYEQIPRGRSLPPESIYSSKNQSSSYGRIRQISNGESSSSRRRDRDYRDESTERLMRRPSDSRGYRDHERSNIRRYHSDARGRHADSRSDRRGYR